MITLLLVSGFAEQIPPTVRTPMPTYFSAYYLPAPEPADAGESALLTEDGKYLIKRSDGSPEPLESNISLGLLGQERFEEIYARLMQQRGSKMPLIQARDRFGPYASAPAGDSLNSSISCVLAVDKNLILSKVSASKGRTIYQGIGTIDRKRRKAFVEGGYSAMNSLETLLDVYRDAHKRWRLMSLTETAKDLRLSIRAILPGVPGSYRQVPSELDSVSIPKLYKLLPRGPGYMRTRLDLPGRRMATWLEGGDRLIIFAFASRKISKVRAYPGSVFGSGLWFYKGRMFANMRARSGDASTTRLYEYSSKSRTWSDRGPYVLVARSRGWRFALFLDARDNRHFLCRMP